jgi:branched-chain amino acid aminotransferase
MSNKATTKSIWFNGKFVPWDEANVHVMTHALHYGTSVFEGLRAYDTPNGTIIFRLKEHMQRLLNSARIYRISIPYSLEELCQACCDLMKENELKFGYIRPLAFIGNVGLGVKPPADAKIEVIMGVLPWGAYLGEEGMKKGVKVGVSSWRRLAPDTIPTGAKAGGNYLSSLLISNEAKQHGYAEGIALDVDGYLAEGSGENIFLVKDGVLYTSPISCAILPGITRDCVMKLAEDMGYKVREERIHREALYLADEIFMTGSAAEITPVSEVDGFSIGCGSRGPVTEKIQDAFFGLFNGKTEDKWGWLYPVK